MNGRDGKVEKAHDTPINGISFVYTERYVHTTGLQSGPRVTLAFPVVDTYLLWLRSGAYPQTCSITGENGAWQAQKPRTPRAKQMWAIPPLSTAQMAQEDR